MLYILYTVKCQCGNSHCSKVYSPSDWVYAHWNILWKIKLSQEFKRRNSWVIVWIHTWMLQTAKTPLFIEVVTLADDWWNLISSTWFLLSAVEMTHPLFLWNSEGILQSCGKLSWNCPSESVSQQHTNNKTHLSHWIQVFQAFPWP